MDDNKSGQEGCYMITTNKSPIGKTDTLCISFIADSGACDHIIKDKCALTNFKSIRKSIRSANRRKIAILNIVGEGEIFVKSNCTDPNWQQPFILTKVKYSPDISENLLSSRPFTDLGYKIELNNTN